MPHEIPRRTRAVADALLNPLERYHQFRAEGLHHVPRSGPAIFAVHHSLASYDAFLLGRAVMNHTQRLPIGLGDDNLFRIPGVRQFCYNLGIRPAHPTTAETALANGELLMLAPGGTREAIRPSTQRNQSMWHDRFGFVRLAIKTQAPVVLGACPRADDIYRVYESRLTQAVYSRTRWPFPILRGRGPTLIPRKVALVGYVSEPQYPPATSVDDEDAVRAFHATLTQRMAGLLALP